MLEVRVKVGACLVARIKTCLPKIIQLVEAIASLSKDGGWRITSRSISSMCTLTKTLKDEKSYGSF